MWALKRSGGFQVALVVKNSPSSVGDIRDMGLIPGWERSPGEGHGNPIQYSSLKNPMEKTLAGYRRWGHKELDMTEPLTLSLFTSIIRRIR